MKNSKYNSCPHSWNQHVVSWLSKVLTPSINSWLLRLPLKEEVKGVVFKLKKNTTLRSNGIISKFYQHHWEHVKADIMKLMHEFFKGIQSIKYLNSTFITLLLKLQSLSEISQYKPIACIKLAYKILLNILANRLFHILSKLISMNQYFLF